MAAFAAAFTSCKKEEIVGTADGEGLYLNKVELTLERALSYLRCEALTLPDAAAGILLLTYENVPLGFVKNVGNHCNNLYPKEWRIRKL